ncbi:Rhodopsin archaeal/bacterial/fungal [Penicillium verhagenii]|uniref:Rhodopsin archaeal/bacterial/fungal n=1 Tax=Penicillium verhagenii TaxID=1562060 RepID=UPI0025452B7A|nr:Rhodopsin archaeal/bacterial/fungal [Penicillium verhagenii]KAJ5935827.1 Rhodopsin archaeal/bacterial/fungal [Penicillium verhagenii]
MIVPSDFGDFPTPIMPSHTTTSVAPIPTVIPGLPITQELGITGQRTLWVVTVLMGISSLVFYSLSARAPLQKRVFHTLSALITTTSFITYLALSTNQGYDWTVFDVIHKNKHVPDTYDTIVRSVGWARFVNWALTTPLLLINFALVSGLPGANLFAGIAANWVMLASAYFGSFAGHTPVRWVWLTLTCLAFLSMLHHAGFHAQRAAQNKDASTRRFFGAYSGLAFFALALFPITLAAGTLALKITVDTETILYAIQDIFVQGLLSYWLVVSHDSAQGITLHLDGFWSHGFGNEGAIRIEEEGA